MANADTPPGTSPAPLKVKAVMGELGLNSTVTVEIKNLSAYLEQPGRDGKKFTLYPDWHPIKGVVSRSITGTDKLQFDVMRTADSKDAWNALLGEPLSDVKGFTYPVAVSVGYENENPIATDITDYPLVVIEKGWFWTYLGLFLFILLLFIWLTRASNIIRDPGPDLPAGQQRTYSLGRFQMAFWLFAITSSYAFIWMVMGDLESVTESTLTLMGISAGTALGAAVVGDSKRTARESKLQELKKENATLSVSLTELSQQIATTLPPANLVGLQKEVTEKNAR